MSELPAKQAWASLGVHANLFPVQQFSRAPMEAGLKDQQVGQHLVHTLAGLEAPELGQAGYGDGRVIRSTSSCSRQQGCKRT